MKIISLGWGVQSFGLAAMSALGELPKVDFAIHADTGFERQATIDFAKKWTPWLEERGIKVVTVRATVKPSVVNDQGGIALPVHTLNIRGDGGQFKRDCTRKWKIRLIRQWLQKNRNGEKIEMWIGISTDENHRAKEANVKYIKNSWPLLDKQFSRNDIIGFLKNNNIEVPVKSACYICPFQTLDEWKYLRKNEPENFKKAIELDKAIRDLRPPYKLFLHSSHKSLSEIDFRTEEEKGQQILMVIG